MRITDSLLLICFLLEIENLFFGWTLFFNETLPMHWRCVETSYRKLCSLAMRTQRACAVWNLNWNDVRKTSRNGIRCGPSSKCMPYFAIVSSQGILIIIILFSLIQLFLTMNFRYDGFFSFHRGGEVEGWNLLTKIAESNTCNWQIRYIECDLSYFRLLMKQSSRKFHLTW